MEEILNNKALVLRIIEISFPQGRAFILIASKFFCPLGYLVEWKCYVFSNDNKIEVIWIEKNCFDIILDLRESWKEVIFILNYLVKTLYGQLF